MGSHVSPPQVAVISDVQCIAGQQRYTMDRIPIDAIARVVRAQPIILPPIEDALGLDSLLEQLDGIFISGGLTNVHPGRYHHRATSRDEPFDDARDNFVLPVITAILDRGIPLLATCRGFQELNVTLGGTLCNEPDDLPHDLKHGTPDATTEDERYRLRQKINIKKDGVLWRALGKEEVEVNSLHSQLIDRLSPRLHVEAVALDGTVEAARVAHSKGFALGTMFHPEYWAENDETSLRILQCFSAAVREFSKQRAWCDAAE